MISIIAAVGKNNEIGKNNDLIWHIKEDLQNFKNLTMNKYIVMEQILMHHYLKDLKEENILYYQSI